MRYVGVSTKETDFLIVMTTHRAKQGSILAHIFAVLGVVCGGDTNSQDTRDEDSAKSGNESV